MASVESGMDATSIGRVVERAAQSQGTWAGGATRAIYAYPPSSISTPASARVWVGTAAIQHAAAYSFFPGRRRIHIPIQGNGIRLNFGDPAEIVTLPVFAQHQFDGARPVYAEPVDGPLEAFNLIVEANVSAAAHVLHFDRQAPLRALPSLPAARAGADMRVVRVVYAAAGALELRLAGRRAARLEPGDAFVLGPRTVADAFGDCGEVQCMGARAELVLATLMFYASA